MKQIPLTKGYVALVDDEDFVRLSGFKWCASVMKTGVYAVRALPRNRQPHRVSPMHRELLGVSDPKVQIDHIDHNGLNNTRSNLRLATKALNQRNQRKQPNRTSSFKGVSWDASRNRWRAQVKVDSHNHFLGRFATESDAAIAYDTGAIKYHEDFAHLNFPERAVI